VLGAVASRHLDASWWQMTRTVAIDLFCGAGGMTNGLIGAGVHVLAGVDNEPLCRDTYRQNRNADGSTPEYLCMDIFPRTSSYPQGQQEEISERIDELIKAYKRKTGYRKINLILAVCAPCQPFTKITRIEMSEERQFKRSNDKNLLLTTVGLVSKFRPDAVICENVEGMISGADSVLASYKRRLARLGYEFDAKIVNAARFGVPQNRKRTIGVAFDKNKHQVEFEVPIEDEDIRFPPTVQQAIGHLPAIAAGEVHPKIPNHRTRALSSLNLKRISCAPPGESNAYLMRTPYGDLSLDCHRRLIERTGSASFSDTYTRMKGDELAPTITTKCIAVSNGRFAHFDIKQNRAISPREAAILQTFPDDYAFYPEENLDFTARLIGNAVPPRLAQYFGRFLRDRIEAK
jgi:DNA (cytosine-5)-methyltransferase 1